MGTIEVKERDISIFDKVKKLIQYFLFAFLLIVVFFLFLRILMQLFGANPQTFFSLFIYGASDILLLPFFGIFPKTPIAGRSTIDTQASFALLAYILLFLLVLMLLQIAETLFKWFIKLEEDVEERKEEKPITKIKT